MFLVKNGLHDINIIMGYMTLNMILNMKFLSIYFTLLSNFIMKDEWHNEIIRAIILP